MTLPKGIANPVELCYFFSGKGGKIVKNIPIWSGPPFLNIYMQFLDVYTSGRADGGVRRPSGRGGEDRPPLQNHGLKTDFRLEIDRKKGST